MKSNKTYVMTSLLIFIIQIKETDDAANQNDETEQPMFIIMLDIFDATRSEKHIQWDVQLQHAD